MTIEPSARRVLVARENRSHHLERRARRGELHRIRRGAYVQGPAPTDWHGRCDDALAMIVALRRQLSSPFVLSHTSAALWWGLPLVGDPLVTHIVQRTRPSARHDPRVKRHVLALRGDEIVTVRGVRVTTLERTALDCACACSDAEALVVVDAALRAGADRALLTRMVAANAGRRGIVRARTTVCRADPGAESLAESLTRHHLIEDRLTPISTQIAVDTRRGRFRIDLGWPAVKVGVEFDGRLKYEDDDGRSPAQIIFREKQRHDAIVELGWLLLRVTWDDLGDPADLCRRARALIRRQLRNRDVGSWRHS